MSFELTVLLLRLALVAILYLFLLQIFLIIRRDLLAVTPPGAEEAPGRLVVVESGCPDLPPGQALVLAPHTTLGRSPGNTHPLKDDYVSAEHAALIYREGRWWLRDLGSTNGTYLDNRLLDRETAVGYGSLIEIGSVKLRLERR